MQRLQTIVSCVGGESKNSCYIIFRNAKARKETGGGVH